MYYYEVWIASQRYHGDKPLTYSYTRKLSRGDLVVAPLNRSKVIGIVSGSTDKPAGIDIKQLSGTVTETRLPEKTMRFATWLRGYYPSPPGSLLQTFIPGALMQKSRGHSGPGGAGGYKKITLPPLTPEQAKSLASIQGSKASAHLLHGATGTGKTRVYVELARRKLEQGQSCLVLTPEIGLVPQLVQVFEEALGREAIAIHSMLTPAQKRNHWLRILESTSPVVVIGTRSALFSPIKDLGLIVMDESHDHSYKQEQAPYYQTSRIAARLAEIHQATFVMGSATPSVADYFVMKEKRLPIIRMSSLAMTSSQPPEVALIKMGDKENFKSSAYISDMLIRSIEQAVKAKEQALVFLNRRGTARLVMCQNCGWQSSCPHCDVVLTYHGDNHKMRCHICGYASQPPSSCPDCRNTEIIFKSIGTKYLVEELARLFPKARIQRFDADSSKAERLERHYDDIKAGHIDILVGTQLLGKGLDLPKLSVVGVVMADTALVLPDYTANETAYQQLTQIIGRVGRGHRPGKVIIQSYQPENPAIRAAIRRDYEAFYNQEIKERELYGFPPFRFLLKLECIRATAKGAENAANNLAKSLHERYGKAIEISGPTPSFHGKVSGKYRWQLVIKAKQRTLLTLIIKELPANWAYDIDPVNLL